MRMADKAPAKIGAKALEQEAARVFRRLVETGSYVASLGGHLAKQEEYGVFVARNKHKKPIMKLKYSILLGFVAQDWVIEKAREQWQLTPQGEAWLARKLAANDPYRTQHQLVGTREIKITETRKIKVTINQGESPLGWLLNRKGADGKPMLSQPQYDAGERIRTDFEQAQMSPRITADLSQALSGSSNKRAGDAGASVLLRNAAIAAKKRFFKALDAVGPDLSEVLVEVCCFMRGMEEAEKQLRLPQRSGKIVLQIALTRLGMHYGLIMPDTPRWSKSPALRHWGDKDFRPEI